MLAVSEHFVRFGSIVWFADVISIRVQLAEAINF